MGPDRPARAAEQPGCFVYAVDPNYPSHPLPELPVLALKVVP
jgi:hypothetical protein